LDFDCWQFITQRNNGESGENWENLRVFKGGEKWKKENVNAYHLSWAGKPSGFPFFSAKLSVGQTLYLSAVHPLSQPNFPQPPLPLFNATKKRKAKNAK